MKQNSFYQFGQLRGEMNIYEIIVNRHICFVAKKQDVVKLQAAMGISNESLVHFVAKFGLALMSSYFETS